MRRNCFLIVVLALTLLGSGAYAYDFWGITIGTAAYNSSQQLTFSGVGASGVQYAVGSYQYTQVDGAWTTAHVAADPGTRYRVHRKFDAMGMFFKADPDAARFVVITGMPQTGVIAEGCGYGNRQFGPGDLKIDLDNGDTYGVGFRMDGLMWVLPSDPNPTLSYYQIHDAVTGLAINPHSQDVGTQGEVELNPNWAHVDNPALTGSNPHSYAFYVQGSGKDAGAAQLSVVNTGVSFVDSGYTTAVFAYEAVVPWEVLDMSPGSYTMHTSWRPDCGNDLIAADFTGGPVGRPNVPEPFSMLLAITGLGTLAAARRRR